MKSNSIDRIIQVAREAWNLGLVAGKSGNISVLENEKVLMTKSSTSLGFLERGDFIELEKNGNVIKGERPSSEMPLHLAIYNNTDAKAVVHLHPTYSTAYFLENDKIVNHTFEERLVLGHVPVVEQKTPTVTEIEKALNAFKLSNIVVLKNHGVVAIGEDLFDAFFLIQTLEHAVKIDLVRSLSGKKGASGIIKEKQPDSLGQAAAEKKTYKLFSKEQIDKIVELVNQDEKFLSQAKELDLTLTLAVKLNEENLVYNFKFDKGKITAVTNTEDAQFLVSGPKAVWEAVFRRQIDPFVATTQKKLNLKGDFAKLSKWYAPFARLFQLWQQAPVD